MATIFNPKKTVKLAIALLALGIIGAAIPVLANETPKPLVTPTGTSQDLNGVEQRDIAQDLGGMGGTYQEEEISDSVYQPQMSPYEAKIQSLNLTLEQVDNNVGDTNRVVRRFPFTNF